MSDDRYILVIADGSKEMEVALQYACARSKKTDRKIIIKKTGIGDKIYQFAQEHPASYGILSILFDVFAGLAAATAFRRL